MQKIIRFVVGVSAFLSLWLGCETEAYVENSLDSTTQALDSECEEIQYLSEPPAGDKTIIQDTGLNTHYIYKPSGIPLSQGDPDFHLGWIGETRQEIRRGAAYKKETHGYWSRSSGDGFYNDYSTMYGLQYEEGWWQRDYESKVRIIGEPFTDPYWDNEWIQWYHWVNNERAQFKCKLWEESRDLQAVRRATLWYQYFEKWYAPEHMYDMLYNAYAVSELLIGSILPFPTELSAEGIISWLVFDLCPDRVGHILSPFGIGFMIGTMMAEHLGWYDNGPVRVGSEKLILGVTLGDEEELELSKEYMPGIEFDCFAPLIPPRRQSAERVEDLSGYTIDPIEQEPEEVESEEVESAELEVIEIRRDCGRWP